MSYPSCHELHALVDSHKRDHKSDYEECGKLYPLLDSFVVLKLPGKKEKKIFWDSSRKFRTQKAYKQWLESQDEFKHLKFKVKKV